MHDENDVRGYSWRGSIVQCLQWINFHLLKCFLNADWQFDQRTDHHDWLTVSMIDLLNSVWHSNLSNQSRRHGNTENGYEKTIIFQICMRSNCTPPRKKAILIQKTSFSFLRYHVAPNSWTFNHVINLINQTQPTIPWTALFKPPLSASYKFIN